MQDFIVINDVIYRTGTIFIIDFRKRQEATFICYIPKTNRVRCKLSDTTWFIEADVFRNRIIEITNRVDPSVHMPVVKTRKDWEIDGLFLGWIWYIFLMGISAIFKDAIGLWLLISFVFFNWRSRKIKEEGTYLEW